MVFPAAKPADSCVIDWSPWFDDFGACCQHDPRVFFSLFDKVVPVKKETEDKFAKVAADKKKATTALPAWSGVFRLGDIPDYFKVPKVNESFSCLLDRPVSNSRYASILLEEMTKLETCIRGDNRVPVILPLSSRVGFCFLEGFRLRARGGHFTPAYI